MAHFQQHTNILMPVNADRFLRSLSGFCKRTVLKQRQQATNAEKSTQPHATPVAMKLHT